MSGFQQALAAATKALQSSGLPFAVVGGVAVSARTEPRFTQDVDFTVAVQTDEADLHRLAAVASASEWGAANELVVLIADRGYGDEEGLRAVFMRLVSKRHL